MNVSIYASREAEARKNADATVVIADEPDSKGRYALERIDARDSNVRERVARALKRDSVSVARVAVGSMMGSTVKSRGVGRAEAPQGSPAFWRAALAFPDDDSLSADLDDYGILLAAITPPDHAPERAPATARRKTSEPAAEKSSLLDPLLWALALGSLKLQLAGVTNPPVAPRTRVRTRGEVRTRGALAPTRGKGGESSVPASEPQLDFLFDRLRQDPEFLAAVVDLGLASSIPERKQDVFDFLQKLAREATEGEDAPAEPN